MFNHVNALVKAAIRRQAATCCSKNITRGYSTKPRTAHLPTQPLSPLLHLSLTAQRNCFNIFLGTENIINKKIAVIREADWSERDRETEREGSKYLCLLNKNGRNEIMLLEQTLEGNSLNFPDPEHCCCERKGGEGGMENGNAGQVRKWKVASRKWQIRD